jgi:glutathione synthase/RimK-type ligase-like ATP-grasp enzyme
VALATCAAFPELDPDDGLLLSALRDAGIDAAPAVWDDPDVNWDAYALTVVRETWDYSFRRDEFVTWARRVPRLVNHAGVLTWNSDKRYLRALQERGVAIVPTQWFEPGDRVTEDVQPCECVVKPAVSAGSRDTERYSAAEHESAVAHVRRLLDAGRVAMVQPYVASVDHRGETALVYIAGVYSHAVSKAAILTRRNAIGARLFAEETITPYVPTAQERHLGEMVLSVLPLSRDALLYARVDVVSGDDGAPQLLELELTEPSLFFAHADTAPQRMVQAITALLEDPASHPASDRVTLR